MEPLSPEQLSTCIRVLEALVADRLLLSEVPRETRQALMVAAGRLSRPERLEMMKVAKLHRRQRRKKDRNHDRELRAASEIRSVRREAVFTAPAFLPPQDRRSRGRFKEPQRCYVCKAEYVDIHFFYDKMCPRCGDFNYGKRFQTARLDGQVALVTGARVKIGFQASLMLLRAGATVLATTRFPVDAAERYRREPDFDSFRNRLHVFGLDLRHSPSVELFARYVDRNFDRLDILLNNACQTVRRPPGFYAHLMETESRPAPPGLRGLLAAYEDCKAELSGLDNLPRFHKGVEGTWLSAWGNNGPGVGLRASAALSQIPYAYEDEGEREKLFPEGERDADLQQVDLRGINSWRLRLADVPAAEMMEVQLVNAVAPFILCSKLKPLMLRRRDGDKHIVNVSAMEGKFSRYTKTDKHPHTNMAKAALNMMTLTSAPDYARDRIYMNAVDTGWVTDEDPVELSLRKQAEHDFQPPLDIVDGAARIVDPVFSVANGAEPQWGKFLKDYRPTEW